MILPGKSTPPQVLEVTTLGNYYTKPEDSGAENQKFKQKMNCFSSRGKGYFFSNDFLAKRKLPSFSQAQDLYKATYL